MASGNGVAGRSKRKRGEGSGSKRKQGQGSCSGDGQEYPGDPPTADHDESFLGVTEDHAEASTFSGVGVRLRVISEIKNWACSGPHDRKGRDFLVDVNLPDEEDVETRKMAAATIRDCAQLYWNPKHPVKSLNIFKVERWLRKPQVLNDEDCIGKHILDEYVRVHPVAPAPLEWKGLDKNKFNALKNEIVNRGLEFFKILRKKIAEGELSRAGRQRQDEDQIFPRVEDNEPANLDSEEEIKRLEDQIACMKVTHAGELRARDDKIAVFVENLKTDDAIIELQKTKIETLEHMLGLRFLGAQS